MADNFFGFHSDFPKGFGILERHDIDDDILTDEVEEEYDALNDETFGQAANEDWEEAHEKLSELIKNNNIDVKSYFHDSLLENDDSQEEIVSKSISQLGLEDDLDDPAIMTISRNCHSSSRLGSGFGPSPPPPAILETELCGSPKTHSIWSTTPKDSGISFLQSLSHGSNSLSHKEPRTSLNSVHDNVFITPQKAWRAEELERDMLSSSKREKPFPTSTWPQTSPHSSSNQNLSNAIQTQRFPNLNHNQNKINQRVFTREEVERQLHSDPRIGFHNKVGNFAQHHLPSPLARQNIMGPASGNLNSLQSSPVVPLRLRGPMMGGPERPYVPFPNNLHPRNMLHSHQMIRPDFMNRPMHNHPMGGVMNPYMGMPGRHINHPLMPNWRPPFIPYDKYEEDDYINELENTDDYAGLMSQREKDWLVRIQMLQLKSENPYVEDYYYTTMVARKFQKKYSENAKKGGGDAPELILPEAPKPENKAYVPTQFEGSLGKLQAVSVNFPRKVLDIKVTRPLEDDEGRVVTNQSLMKYRRLLLDIEKNYTSFLQIEDEERRILAKPDSGEVEAPHRKNIASLILKVFSGLISDHTPDENLQSILTIRKGRSLFMRVFPRFSEEQQLKCLICLCQCISLILKKDQNDLILVKNHDIVMSAILKFSIPDLVQMGDALENGLSIESCKEKSNFIAALKNKFGSSVICTMVKRAENLYSGYDLFESDVQTKWAKLMLLVVDLLCNIDNSSLCPPLSPSCELLKHFQRFAVDRDKFEILKEKLKVLEMGSLNGEIEKNI